MLVQPASAGTPDALASVTERSNVAYERRDAGRFDARFEIPHRVSDPRLVASAKRANGVLKRTFDILGSIGLLVFLAPFLITIAIAVKLSGPGPVIFSHRRVGRRGKPFPCYKFRTMVADADAVLEAHLAADPEAAKEWRETQKLKKDPRVTWIGRALRATSLDELPQLANVLVGQMSLVGPRPVTKAELDERYAKDRRYYLLIRPGLTGLWQVSGRNSVSYRRRIELDQEYVREWSFRRDAEILIRTVSVVLKREGAS